jgi:hypothetical protein
MTRNANFFVLSRKSSSFCIQTFYFIGQGATECVRLHELSLGIDSPRGQKSAAVFE